MKQMDDKFLLLDVDGLLLDTEKVFFKCWKEASASLGFSLEDQLILQLRSCDSSLAQEKLTFCCNNSDAYSLIRKKRRELMNDYTQKNGIDVKPGAIELIQRIEKEKVGFRIVSSSPMSRVVGNCALAGLMIDSKKVIDLSDCKRNKPFPDIYEKACQLINRKPHDCLAVEDSPNGVESAYKAGCCVVMIPDLSQPTTEDKKRALIMSSLFDLIRYLFS